jgi:DNA repair protein RadA/Sms
MVLAIASARSDHAIDPDTVVIGEVGLGGEIRQVPHTLRRLSEALRLGFREAVVPMSTPDVRGIRLVRTPTLREALGTIGVDRR